ncbi:hypothetical protein F5B22DRAFT_658828 [Xylaria bambusicola]|uniref:uncharacterized protein n=1 Tax=Xylaria bambusicola TaxID=326684 RepID=UPI00200780BA|nr:uncharacterized protein F5B22DRAFT_658828 [Xylaria bambusicola]KAI0508904.1 hypothetical protein F5B22DRAFT_658828 [Xylaria bambusicola]
MAVPLPQSPWAKRFGDGSILKGQVCNSLLQDGGHTHSGIAPMRPWLDPRYYDSKPKKDEFTTPVTGKEIDEALATEKLSRNLLMGVPAWKAVTLNSVLSCWGEDPVILSGHRPEDAKNYAEMLEAYKSQRIEVRPETWLPFFKKDRWYDLFLVDVADTIERADGSKRAIRTWTMDDERIWHEVSFILELANRILMTLIKDNNTWLGTLMYGHVQRWYELYGDASRAAEHVARGENWIILLTPSFEWAECVRLGKPFLGRAIEPDAEKRETLICQMLKNHAWSFVKGDVGQRGDTSWLEPQDMTFSRINVAYLKHLVGGTISVAERCVLHLKMAQVVLHELMHAIYFHRVHTYHGDMSADIRGRDFHEPFVNGESIAELGRSWEKAALGGTPLEVPGLSNRLPVADLHVKFPSRLGASSQGQMLPNSPELDFFAPIYAYYIPAAVFWRMQSKSFWATNPHGELGFRYPQFIYTELRQARAHPEVVIKDTFTNRDPRVRYIFKEILRKWDEQGSLWASSRPWFAPALDVWERTPWSYVSLRTELEKFIEAYQKKDESECASIAEFFVCLIPPINVTKLSDTEQRLLMPNSPNDGEPSLWIWHCLGLLMTAALPLQKADKLPTTTQRGDIYSPGKAAYQAGWRVVAVNSTVQVTPRIHRRDSYWDRFNDFGKHVLVASRVEFVHQAAHMIAHVMETRQAYASSPVLRALNGLFAHMFNVLTNPSFDQSSWLPDFPFQFPDYEPDAFDRWDPTNNSLTTFRRVPGQADGTYSMVPVSQPSSQSSSQHSSQPSSQGSLHFSPQGSP